jgi:hypothetical protein
VHTHLEGPSKRLKIGDGYTVSYLTIAKRVLGQGQSVLRVYHFKNGGFSGLITQSCQAQAFGGQVGGLAQGFEFGPSGLCLAIKNLKVGDHFPLRFA